MGLLRRSQKFFTALALVVVLMTTAACGGTATSDRTGSAPGTNGQASYTQIQQGNTPAGQDFGQWVVQTGRGLIQDAYVRDNDKLGVVITPQVQPTDVRPLARSLVQGFQRNFPDRNLTVMMYAPDRQLILTARYDNQSRQIQYQ